MKLLCFLPFFGLLAVVWSNRCHFSDDANSLHCGDYVHMNCSDVHYAPYCHRLYGQRDGVCTCEQLCTRTSECSDGCLSSRYTSVCTEAYTGAVEKICRCRRNH